MEKTHLISEYYVRFCFQAKIIFDHIINQFGILSSRRDLVSIEAGVLWEGSFTQIDLSN